MKELFLSWEHDTPYSFEIIRNGLLLGIITGILEGVLVYFLMKLIGGFDVPTIYG
jgi:hypothetical protein